MLELMIEMLGYLVAALLVGLLLGFCLWGWGQRARVAAARHEGITRARTSMDGDSALRSQLENSNRERAILEATVQRLNDRLEGLQAGLGRTSARREPPRPYEPPRRADAGGTVTPLRLEPHMQAPEADAEEARPTDAGEEPDRSADHRPEVRRRGRPEGDAPGSLESLAAARLGLGDTQEPNPAPDPAPAPEPAEAAAPAPDDDGELRLTKIPKMPDIPELRDVPDLPETGEPAAEDAEPADQQRADENPAEAPLALRAGDAGARRADDAPGARPAPAEAGAEEDPDDLTQIDGIGAITQRVLNENGISRFDQLARFTDEDFVWLETVTGISPGQIDRQSWVDQARLLSGQSAPGPGPEAERD